MFAQSDPLTAAGHDEVVAAMRDYFSPEVVALMRANGGDIFYDSHSSDRGAPREVWSNTLPQDFEREHGYDLMPRLAAAMRGTFTFADNSHARIFDDLVDARTKTWLDVHIRPMKQFVRDEYNYVLRVQPEGENSSPIFDMAYVAAQVDRPEHENLFASDEVDNYLPVASANHMTGNPWYSTECCALGGGNYLQTYGDVLPRMAKSYAGGITKLFYHTYPYTDTPTHRWPGYANWGNTSFGTAWGPRQPMWQDAKAYNEYFARHDQVLTQGDGKVDVAVFYQNYLYPEAWSTAGGFRIWRDMGLQNAGYTRDYLSPELMKLPNAEVRDGRLAPQGPAYKALIIDTTLEPATDPVKTSMPLDAAARILKYARSGLPVVLVGPLPDRTTGNSPQRDARLQDVIDELVATRGVHRVASQAEVPDLLKEVGIRPAAEPRTPTSIVSQRRYDAATNTDDYFVYNEGRVGAEGRPERSIFEPPAACAITGTFACVGTGDDVKWTLSLEGEGYPFLMDATSGDITPIAQYRTDKRSGRVEIPLSLARDESALIAISRTPSRFGPQPVKLHATETEVDGGLVKEHGDVVARSTQEGVFSTTLSNGQSVTSTFQDVPDAQDLTNNSWALAAEDWRPANAYATTFGPAATETTKNVVDVSLAGLKPWTQIAGLERTSGLGTYKTTFDLPSDWTSRHGAFLSLGEVHDSFTVKVNGTEVPANQTSAELDLRDELRAGTNTLEVRVATNLNNRLTTLDPAIANRMILNYGLIGPVTLTPYESQEVRLGNN